MKTGVKLSVGLLPTLALLAGCATSQRLAVVSWDQFVAQSAGVPQRWNDYAPANVKIVESLDAGDSMEASKDRFRAWCSAHGGVSSSTSHAIRSNATTGLLHQAVSLKSNAEQAASGKWKPIESFACVEQAPAGAFLGSMVIELEPAKGSSWPVGRYKGQLTYAFFTRPQVEEFAATYARLETERTQRFQSAAREREERRAAATRKLQREPRVGDRTNLGTIIEVRPPLALLQYDERYRAVSNRPSSEWVRIDTLSAPSDQ
jgi:hypothetical protein